MENHVLAKYPRLLILACSVIERELLMFQKGRMEFKFFDYGLHQTPEKMAMALQVEIDRLKGDDFDGIVLGYGLCSNGIVGVKSSKHPLIIPRVHDCIALFLGSPEAYREQSAKHPGTYYLTPGWLEKGQTPLSKFESYRQSYDEKTARWVLHEEMKNYKRIALIDTGLSPLEPYRELARANARFLEVDYEEIRGSAQLFRALLQGPWDKNFLFVENGQPVRQEMFLDL